MKDVFNVRPLVEGEIKNIKVILNQKYFGEYPEYDSNYAKWSTKAIFHELYFKFDVFRDEDKKYFIEIIDSYIKKLYEKKFEEVEKDEEKTIAILVAMINLTAWEREMKGEYNPYTKYKYMWLNSPTSTGNE